ncbi:formylglycine-generating enzyme family protein [Mesorhizobium sp. NZP2298]|uniref:formylglycine-generating enzyme family protein n=1 Tax=Mesorhizobium sp. NZP2298 TaxID=2483403 RepID=UPI001553415A|nr:SUMF1/EgtB/PvdO family nonheme iron enzyme [Mesorhizobium sp. NZP2298]QKC99044.1 formylglycine-generating enzyme family protein [Mesorhizobium sp. NZP2298]
MSYDPVFTFGTIAAAALIGLGVNHAVDGMSGQPRRPVVLTDMVHLAPGSFNHPQLGEFLKDDHSAPAPVLQETIDAPLEIMRFQVTASDYDRCVLDRACKPADSRLAGNVPATGVSFIDAQAYANWLSEKTGEAWRLPTDAEWAYAAGERFRADIDIEGGDGDPADPARRWLRQYRNEAALGRKPDPEPRPLGAFGANSKGVADIAGNVWEWTATCYAHATMSGDGVRIASSITNCGVHVVEGFHRTYMSNFIRDGKSGGCAVGTPPDNLGFRLVHDPAGFLQAARQRLGLT